MSTKRAAASLRTVGVAASIVLGDAACEKKQPDAIDARPAESASPTQGPSAQASAPSASSTSAPTTPSTEERLRAAGVQSNAPARRTLYTWTTHDQIVELGRDRVLLTRTESPIYGPSLYDQVIAARAKTGDALAKKLQAPAFARARHAWASAWPTLLGWKGESYGAELIVIELKPEAWTAMLTSDDGDWAVFDKDNAPVPLADAIAHPERIGAVHFVQNTHGAGPGHTLIGTLERPAFREYVLCNEGMIAEWSIGARAEAVIREETALVAGLSILFAGLARPESVDRWNADVLGTWFEAQRSPGIADAYARAIAFPNESYLPTTSAMTALLARLERRKPGDITLTYAPVTSASPPAPVTQPVPPPPKPPKRHGTY